MGSLTTAYRDILKHSSIYGLGQVLRRLASIFLLPFYTRYLSPAEYGCIAILDLTAAILGVLIGSSLAAAVTRYYFEARNHAQRQRVWWTGMAVVAGLASVVVALVWTLRAHLARLTLGPEESLGGLYYQIILLNVWCDAFGQILDAQWRIRKWSAAYVGTSFLCLLLNIGLNVYFLAGLHLGVRGLLFGNLIAAALYRAFQLIVFGFTCRWHGVEWPLALRFIKFSSPLVITSLLALVMHQADRYLLRLFVGLDQVGIYALAYSIGQAINTFCLLPFASIWGVVIYEIAEQRDAKRVYARVFQYFVYFEMLLFLGVSLFAKPLLRLATPPEYAQADDIVPIVCLGYLFFSLHEHFKVPALLAKRTRSLLPAFMTAAVTNIVANLLFIPVLGLHGAAWATVLTFAQFSFLGLWRYRRIDKYDYPLLRGGAVLTGMAASYLAIRLLDWLVEPSGFWLFVFAAFVWSSWAVALFGRDLNRLAFLLRPPQAVPHLAELALGCPSRDPEEAAEPIDSLPWLSEPRPLGKRPSRTALSRSRLRKRVAANNETLMRPAMRPLVSVVIPVYNGSRFLRKAIDSVRNQTYTPIQIVVVDDGSVDDSPDVIRSYGSRVESIRQQNSGVANARNRGVGAAQGEFVAFLDQDDWWLADKVRRQVELFLQNPDLGLVHTEAAHYDHPSNSFVERFNPNRSDLLVGRCYERLLLGNAIFNSSVMTRKSVLDAVGGFDTQIEGNTIQDYDLWLRIARHSALAYIPEQLTVYRLHPDQGMWKARHSLVEELRLLDRILASNQTPLSGVMRSRMAKLLDEVGVAHLDVREVALARNCFARALRQRWSWRDALLLALTFLPVGLRDRVRRVGTGLRVLRRRQVAGRAPSWVTLK